MNAREKTVVIASCIVTSAIGAVFVFRFWADGETSVPVLRAGIFVALIVVVHVAGAAAYAQCVSKPAPSVFVAPIASPLKRAIPNAIIVQVIFLSLSSLLLDYGQSFQICLLGAVGHWIAIGAILLRRAGSPTRVDLLLVKWGFIPLVLLAGRMMKLFHAL